MPKDPKNPKKKNARPAMDGDPIEQKRAIDERLANLDPDVETLFGDAMRNLEAHNFLASGGKFRADGFDLRDPKMRKYLLERTPKEFVEFEINPLDPELMKRLDEIPDDWVMNGERSAADFQVIQAAVDVLEVAIHAHYKLPEWTVANVMPNKRIWVYSK